MTEENRNKQDSADELNSPTDKPADETPDEITEETARVSGQSFAFGQDAALTEACSERQQQLDAQAANTRAHLRMVRNSLL